MATVFTLLSLLLVVAFVVQSSPEDAPPQLEITRDSFDEWMIEHGKLYSGFTKETRFLTFQNNVEYINKHNSQNRSYYLGLNKFADLTNEEFRGKYVGKLHTRPQRHNRSTNYPDHEVSLPSSIDWRKLGAVSEVKDQGSCGSCWAFSAVAAVESSNYLAHGELVSLSEQQLVDCDTDEDEGCDGGLMDDAFQYIINNGGLTSEDDYPYTGHGGSCNRNKEKSIVVSIDSFEDVPSKNEYALLKAVASMPVSVAVEGGGRDFQFYKSGIFTGSCGTDLDHAITLVGYGTESDGKEHWIAKNSWGTSWGESGYMRLERLGEGDGLCGINLEASYPTIYRHRSSARLHEDL